ncbi:hypothetical protein AVEN_258386-1, partial [Araneus ventricosus]
MIGEDLQKFSDSRVMRTIAIGGLPIRNLPKIPTALSSSPVMMEHALYLSYI